MTEAYPLSWPDGRPRTKSIRRQCSRFGNTSVHSEAWFVLDEIRRLGGRYAVVSTDVELRNDGLPYSSRKAPEDPGVAVYFEKSGKQMAFACDRWDCVPDNIRAIGKTIEAIRGIERWGSGDMMAAAFTGFEALPAPDKTPWWEVLGFASRPLGSIDFIEAQYRALAIDAHPDMPTGSHERMTELNAAIEQARREMHE